LYTGKNNLQNNKILEVFTVYFLRILDLTVTVNQCIFVTRINLFFNSQNPITGGILKMAKTKNLLFVLLAALMMTGSVVITGCSSGPSEEQMQQLNDLKAEVESLSSQVSSKNDEKSSLQRQIADKDSKIKGYMNDMDAVKKRCP
jgi:outer membrane murein-binding lipoprotein Lpp